MGVGVGVAVCVAAALLGLFLGAVAEVGVTVVFLVPCCCEADAFLTSQVVAELDYGGDAFALGLVVGESDYFFVR